MPQLLSRRDEAGWLTPAMADILVQRTTPLLPEDTLREQIAEIQQRLTDLETPIRIVDIRPSPSRILYVARPEVLRRTRKAAAPAEIRRSLGKLAEEHPEWTLGFINQLADDTDAVGILLRTPQHQPIRLRQVLLSSTFQHHESTRAIVLGVSLEQQVIVRDMDTLGHLAAVGAHNTTRHLIAEVLLSLTMLNTPAELRVALIGSTSKMFSDLIHTPHALGRLLDQPENGQRLLDGMVREAQRRHQQIAETQAASLEAYNRMLQSRGETPLPRIVLVMASLSDPEWQATSEHWIPALYDLIINGDRVGIYTLLTAEQVQDIPQVLSDVIRTRIIMRSAAEPDMIDNLKHLHTTALRFVDAFIVGEDPATDILPIELCTVGDQDMQQLVSYWRQIATQRAQETRPRERTGLTDLFPELEGSGLGTLEVPRRATGPLPTRTRAGTLARATQVLSGESDEKILAQSMTLAAYLGWLGVGPLRDIFGVSAGEALAIIASLQSQGVLEDGSGPVYRFLRLAENPLDGDAAT
jgi:S-DNA-T family DNA segregation ATPase FtsK/SpoIIIE